MVARNKRLNRKKYLLLLLLVVGVLAISFAYAKYRSTQSAPTAADGSSINLSPATPEEKAESNQRKEEAVNAENQKPPTSGQSVEPVIVDAGQYGQTVEVRSYVPGIIEDGGVCNATFTKGTHKLTRQSGGSKDATTTLCAKITLNKTDFPETGTWSVTIDYKSTTAAGTSQAKTFEVN